MLDILEQCRRLFTELLGCPLNGYYFITEIQALKLCLSGSNYKAYFGEFIDPMRKTLPVHRYSLLLEAVLTAPTGQLLRFCRESEDATEIIPEFKDPGVSQDKFPTNSSIHEGVLRFYSGLMDRFGQSHSILSSLKTLFNSVINWWRREILVLVIYDLALLVEDEYCGSGEISVVELYENS